MNNHYIYSITDRESGCTTSIRNERIEDEFGTSIQSHVTQRNLNNIDLDSLPISNIVTHDSNTISYTLTEDRTMNQGDISPSEHIGTVIQPQSNLSSSHHERRQISMDSGIPSQFISDTEHDISNRQETVGTVGCSVRQIQINPPRNSAVDSTAMSDNEKLEDVLSKAPRIFSMLAEPWVSATPSLRITQISYGGRAFALMTAIKSSISRTVRDDEASGHSYRTPYAAILWQTAKKPPKAICVTMYYERPEDGTSPKFTVVCSCNPSVSVQSLSHLSCEHVKLILGDNPTTTLYKDILWTQLNSQEITRYFGEESFVGDSFSSVCLDNQDVNNNNIINYNHHSQVRGVSQWSFFVQFDVDRNLFVPLKKYSDRRIECLFCRGHRNRRGTCIHETSWENAVFGPGTEDYNGNSEAFEIEERELLLDENDDDEEEDPLESGIPTKIDPTIKYSPTNLKLPLLPCSDIDHKMVELASKIKQVKGRKKLQIRDEYGICPNCLFERDDKPLDKTQSIFRTTKLYTLRQQIPLIEVEDWKCPSCTKLVYFTGIGTALFPVRRTFTYTYEMLYHFVHNVCRLGISFRAQYESYRMTQISASAKAIFDDYCGPGASLQQDIDDCRSGRRRASEAFRLFISCIDTTNSQLCEQLFSCKDCEVPLTTVDKVSLGLHENDVCPTDKRFKALVIDGTTAGILHELPRFERTPLMLSVSPHMGKKQRVVTNQLMYSSLSLLFKLLQLRIRTVVNRRMNFSSSSTVLHFKLPLQKNKSRHRSNKYQFSMQQLACLRVILNVEKCVCDPFGIKLHSTRHLHNSNCSKANKIFNEIFIDSETIRLLQAVLSMGLREEGSDVSDSRQVLDEDGASSGSSDSDSSSIIDLISSDNDPSDDSEEDGSRDDDENIRQKHWYISFNIPMPRKCSQVIEAYLDVLKFMLFDNVMLPYMRPPSSILDNQIGQSNSDYISQRQELLFESNGSLKLESPVIGYDALQAHDRFCSALEQFADCSHVPYDAHPCVSCTQIVAKLSLTISEINPIFSRIIDQILLHSAYISSKARMLIDELANAFREHSEMAQYCFNNISNNISPECKDYWRKYSGNKLSPLHTDCDQSIATGISFPGRKQYRPFFTFDQKEDRQCGKRYPGSSSHSPGLLCVQCACSNPKLIGYVIMTRAESTSLALSAMMGYFKILPVVVLYDNACNTLAAALLRLPWFLLLVFLIVDRFHYKGHKCNALYDADIYKRLDKVKSSVAESINAKVKRALYNMRFIAGDKLVQYLNIRFALLNLEAKYYEVTGKRDVEDVDLNRFYGSIVPCSCRVTHSFNDLITVMDTDLSTHED